MLAILNPTDLAVAPGGTALGAGDGALVAKLPALVHAMLVDAAACDEAIAADLPDQQPHWLTGKTTLVYKAYSCIDQRLCLELFNVNFEP